MGTKPISSFRSIPQSLGWYSSWIHKLSKYQDNDYVDDMFSMSNFPEVVGDNVKTQPNVWRLACQSLKMMDYRGNPLAYSRFDFSCHPIVDVTTVNINEREIEEMNINKFSQLYLLKENLEKQAIDFAINTLKNKLGKEFLFTADRDAQLIPEVTSKFIKKYDKKYNAHITRNFRGLKEALVNVQYIIPVEKDTFIYVASGKMAVPG
jgi:hypothetical protein